MAFLLMGYWNVSLCTYTVVVLMEVGTGTSIVVGTECVLCSRGYKDKMKQNKFIFVLL